MISSVTTSSRALLAYALILPLALVLGYMLATPAEFGTWATVFVIILALTAPLIMVHHHALLFLSWNMTASVFFFPGTPQIWLVMSGFSLLTSVLQRALSKEMRFLSSPSIVLPLLYLGAVVFITARLTGGFGLHILGSGNVGGKRYVLIFAAILGYLAMVARPVPQEKATRYTSMFFLSSLTDALGSALPFVGPQLYFLFLVFPIENTGAMQTGGFGYEINRFWGLSMAAMGVFFYFLARYGIQGTLNISKPWRLALFLAAVIGAGFGGFRSFYVLMGLTFLCQFYFEGLFRTKYAAGLIISIVLGSALLVPLAQKLPLSMQRTLSILPLDLDPVARINAQASTEWRVDMWKTVLPEVPKYFWLGKGLGISSTELELIVELCRRGSATTQDLSVLSADYHSGPLSVMVPFGIWGVIGMLWFLIAGIRALYLNFVNGDPEIRPINTFLLAYFVARIIHFMFIFGGFHGDLAIFCGIIGLSVSLNHGIRKRAQSPKTVEITAPEAILALEKGIPALPRFSQ